MFPSPVGRELAEAVSNGADPKQVVPDDFVVVRGGASSPSPPGAPFSGAVGRSVEEAASAVPHGQVRVTTAGAIRAAGGTVTWVPEVSRHGTINRQHVDIVEQGPTVFSDLRPSPVPRRQRIDGDKK